MPHAHRNLPLLLLSFLPFAWVWAWMGVDEHGMRAFFCPAGWFFIGWEFGTTV